MGGQNLNTQTGGVKPMSIAGRVVSERERLTGMNAAERAWRKKWLHDQVLHPNEPQYVLAERKEMLNPIRRLYRAPLDFIFEKGVAKFTVSSLNKLAFLYSIKFIQAVIIEVTY